MANNKKGLMLKFLTTLLLAIIIFVPACIFVSKFFSISQQAETNFLEFVGEIKEIEKPTVPINDQRVQLLILDDKTALTYFEKGATEVIVEVDAAAPYTDYTIHISKPAKCSSAKGCLCLIQKPEFDITGWGLGIDDKVKVTDNSAACYELDTSLAVAQCNFGQAHSVNSYTCKNGFFIERYLAGGSSWTVGAYYELPRRSSFQLIKEGTRIVLQDTSKPKTP